MAQTEIVGRAVGVVLRDTDRQISLPVPFWDDPERFAPEALEARLARLPLAVQFEPDGAPRGTRFNEAVEGAAYFMVSEALANTLKHAAATRAHVRLIRTGGVLRVEVADDGRGFDPDRAERRGLRGLADRIEALGGTLRVLSRPGDGTRLLATLPATEPRPV